MPFTWFIIWWTMFAVGMYIYDVQTGFNRTDVLPWEIIKFICYLPVVIFCFLLYNLLSMMETDED